MGRKLGIMWLNFSLPFIVFFVYLLAKYEIVKIYRYYASLCGCMIFV